MENTLMLYNTLSDQLERFVPTNKDTTKLYVCGPTIYSKPHIGNMRSIVVYDVLYRTLKSLYNKVTYVRNITDIDDKIIEESKKRNLTIKNITDEAYLHFKNDSKMLNCLNPDIEPKVSQNMGSIIQMIDTLIKLKHAYISEKHVYFDVSTYRDYGRLSNKNTEKLISSGRVEQYEQKRSPLDFVLWKPSCASFDGWDSPWGMGRPGWHIECSAMSTKYLGGDFDIHGGGVDLKFPHHENEIAQSVCANQNSKFAKYWIHNGLVNVNGEKMSKSLGNIITIKDVIIAGFDPSVIRYLYLSTHYSKPLNWTNETLKNAQHNTKKIENLLQNMDIRTNETDPEFKKAILDNLNTPKAISRIHEMIKEFNHSNSTAILGYIKNALDLLGFSFSSKKNTELNQNKINEIIDLRKKAKMKKDYSLADRLREDLELQGIKIRDKENGETEWFI